MNSARTDIVVDGYGVSLTVHRRHLRIESGLGAHRTVRLLPRADRSVRRIVVLADTGMVSLDALRWCADVGIAVVQLDRDGRLLMTNAAPGTDDPRLRRAQAAASTSPVGVEIARALLVAKVDGQATNTADLLGAEPAAAAIRALADRMVSADGLRELRQREADASNIYFGAWSQGVGCRFAAQHDDRVPDHWHIFAARSSPLHPGKTNRSAADPTNALLNYGYALAEAECRIAAIAVGLDPGLGIVHTDTKARDSLALDLLEPVRPVVDRHVLRLLAGRHFTSGDFAETRDGTCRLLDPLTHVLCEQMPRFAAVVGPIAEQVAHTLARSAPGKIALRTPLSRANHKAAQTLGTRVATHRAPGEPRVLPTCRTCGTQLYDKGRQLCAACWPVHRKALSEQNLAANRAARNAARATGVDPLQTPEIRARRHETLLRMKAAETAWREANRPPGVTEQSLHEQVLPALVAVPLGQIQRATGLSNSACSRIRAQKMSPHPRHWDALARLVGRVDVPEVTDL